MSGEPIVTIVGNLTGDPELRYLQGGQAVCGFTVASTPRALNRQTNQWEDGEPMFVRGTTWKEYAENVAESLTKGMRVVMTGRLSVRQYEHNGQQRQAIEMQVDEVGPSLRYARAQVTRMSGNATHASQASPQQPFNTPASNYQPQGNYGPQNGAQDAWPQPSNDLPPF